MEPRLVRLDVAKLPPKPTKFTKRLDDNVRVCAGRFSVTPREMIHFDLVYVHAKSCSLRKDFRIHHCAHASDLHMVENFTSE